MADRGNVIRWVTIRGKRIPITAPKGRRALTPARKPIATADTLERILEQGDAPEWPTPEAKTLAGAYYVASWATVDDDYARALGFDSRDQASRVADEFFDQLEQASIALVPYEEARRFWSERTQELRAQIDADLGGHGAGLNAFCLPGGYLLIGDTESQYHYLLDEKGQQKVIDSLSSELDTTVDEADEKLAEAETDYSGEYGY